MMLYSIITENNAGQYYPDYGYNHPLFSDGMKIYSDSIISEFLSKITTVQRVGFLNEWNDKRDHREKIYITYDSTNKNCQAGDIRMVEFGHAKDDKSLPIINYSIAYDTTNRESLFYEEYAGSIVDIDMVLASGELIIMHLRDDIRNYEVTFALPSEKIKTSREYSTLAILKYLYIPAG